MNRTLFLGLLLSLTTASSVCYADDGAVALPFEETFDNAASLDKYLIIDANNDGKTWEYAIVNYTQEMQAVRYTYSSQKANDWLLTPQFQCEPGREYTLKFTSWLGDSYYNQEYLEVKCGTGDDPSTYKTIMNEEQITVNMSNKKEYEVTFTVETSGVYRIGFHCTSRASQFGLYLDDLSLVAGAINTSPGPVTDLNVTPGAKGALSATISFTTPTKTTEGKTLSGMQKVEIRRGLDTVKTFNSPSVGQQLSYTDNLSESGMVTYKVIAFGTDGSDGTVSEASAYVGIDAPGQVTSVHTADSGNGDINITWTPPSQTGVNGGYVDLSDITYSVYVVRAGIAFPQQRELTTLNYTAENIIYSQTEQELYNYGVSVTSAAGEGQMKLGEGVLVGENYTLPFHESFKGGMHYYWWLDRVGENSFRRISIEDDYNDFSSDNDWGAVTWTPDKAGDQAWLNTGKIDLKAAQNPALSFSLYCTNSTPAKLEVEVWDGDNQYEVAKTIDLSTWNEGNGWREFVVDLTPFRSKDYVIIHFHAISSDINSPILLDNINVAENIEYNLLTSISAPSRALVGDKKTVSVKVGNNGRKDIADYKVRLYVNNELYEECEMHDIAHNSEIDIDFEYVVKATDVGQLSLQTEVLSDFDEIDGDSESDIITMSIGANDLPTVDDFHATVSGNNISFGWTKPQINGYQTTDDFDYYQSWLTSGFGRWTTIDGDQGWSYDLGYNYEYPHHGEPFAFIVFNPKEAGINVMNTPQFEAYSGDQYLACFDADTEYTPQGNNDWLISPELSGNAQTLKFYAKSISSIEHESFEALASSTNTSTASFKEKLLAVNDADNEWTRYTATLPAGTKYFAIHVISKDCFALLVDDITYEPKEPIITGYRIYCGDKLVGEQAEPATTFNLSPADDTTLSNYRMTVVYDIGESPLSNNALDATVGIETIESNSTQDNGSTTLYDLQGRQLNTRPAHGVYIENGKKQVR